MSNIKGSVTDEDKDIRELIKIYYCFFFGGGEGKMFIFYISTHRNIFSKKKIYIYITRYALLRSNQCNDIFNINDQILEYLRISNI